MSITFSKGVRFLAIPRDGETTEASLPSLLQRGVNFTRSQIRSISSQAQGNPRLVTNETRDARRAKCTSNVCGFYRASDGRCGHPRCGCPISESRIIESKTELFSEFCPNAPTFWGPGELIKL